MVNDALFDAEFQQLDRILHLLEDACKSPDDVAVILFRRMRHRVDRGHQRQLRPVEIADR